MVLREWTAETTRKMAGQLEADPHWSRVLASRVTRTIHLAIFAPPYLRRLLERPSAVESRFSVRRCAPFQRVWNGDIVLLKEAAGPVRGIAEVGTTWFFDLTTPGKLEEIREHFGHRLWVPNDSFWASCEGTSYASLIELNELREVAPEPCPKRDRRAWVVLQDANETVPPARRSNRPRPFPTW